MSINLLFVLKSKILCECISKRFAQMVWSALEARNLEQTQTLRPITASSLLSRMLWGTCVQCNTEVYKN